jgi:hypothetical protein
VTTRLDGDESVQIFSPRDKYEIFNYYFDDSFIHWINVKFVSKFSNSQHILWKKVDQYFWKFPIWNSCADEKRREIRMVKVFK